MLAQEASGLGRPGRGTQAETRPETTARRESSKRTHPRSKHPAHSSRNVFPTFAHVDLGLVLGHIVVGVVFAGLVLTAAMMLAVIT